MLIDRRHNLPTAAAPLEKLEMIDITGIMGIVLAVLIGCFCRWFDLPLPAPPKLVGAMLVVFMTLGFITGRMLV